MPVVITSAVSLQYVNTGATFIPHCTLNLHLSYEYSVGAASPAAFNVFNFEYLGVLKKENNGHHNHGTPGHVKLQAR